MTRWILLCGSMLTIVACGGSAESPAPTEAYERAEPAEPAASMPSPAEPGAKATLEPLGGSTLSGEAMFTMEDGQVNMVLEVSGLEPGTYAAHIHENGDCSAPDGTSAGGHWNPTGEDHGRWDVPPFHLGDLGNIAVGEDGTGMLTRKTDLWTLGDGGDRDVVGHAIIVHAEADDFTSQPTGAAGGRIGCGVIE